MNHSNWAHWLAINMNTAMSESLTSPMSVAAPLTSDGLWFGKDLSTSEPISEAAIERAVVLMRSILLRASASSSMEPPSDVVRWLRL